MKSACHIASPNRRASGVRGEINEIPVDETAGRTLVIRLGRSVFAWERDTHPRGRAAGPRFQRDDDIDRQAMCNRHADADSAAIGVFDERFKRRPNVAEELEASEDAAWPLGERVAEI